MLRVLPALAAALLLPACSSSGPASGGVVVGEGVESRVLEVRTLTSGMRGGSGPFTLISLRSGAVVVTPEATGAARADSASAKWDLGLRGNEVILNGGTGGPGGVRGALVEAEFGDVTAPPEALAADGETPCPGGEARVVCHGSGNGWYAYGEGGVRPLPGRTLVVAWPDGAAAKVRFLGYELGAAGERRVTMEVMLLAE